MLTKKYRPKKFSEIVGQQHIISSLKKREEERHSFLFSGSWGVGKTTTARILARKLTCENPTEDGEPCGKCSACLTPFEEIVTEINAAETRGIDTIREIIDQMSWPPLIGRKKVLILDEVHQLTPQAFQALLKPLEEPKPWTVFILITTSPEKIPSTIISRCVHFRFPLLKEEEIFSFLVKINEKERLGFSQEQLRNITNLSGGHLRDALSILEESSPSFFSQSSLIPTPSNFLLSLLHQKWEDAIKILDRQDSPFGFGQKVLEYATDLIREEISFSSVKNKWFIKKVPSLSLEDKKKLYSLLISTHSQALSSQSLAPFYLLIVTFTKGK